MRNIRRNSRILITGAAGFIGQAATISLSRTSEVVLYDLATGQDILDRDCLASAMQGVSTVIHLAALAGVRPSIADPDRYRLVNVEGTRRVAEAAKAASVKHLIFASSSSVYGDTATAPFAETEQNLQPVSPYGQTKLDGERLLQNYASFYAVTCLRFFTVYGPQQRSDLFIGRAMKAIAAGEEIQLYDTASSRDYTYIADIVSGIEAAIAKPDGYQIYNLGSGNPVTLPQLIQQLEQVTGLAAKTKILGQQVGDMKHTYADTSKARARLDWQPKTTLADGLAMQWQSA